MSNKIKETRKKIRQKIDAIKRAKDNAKDKANKFVDGYENKALKGADDLSKTLSDFSAKKLKKLEGGINRASDVFSDLLETVEKFVSAKNIKVESSDKLFSKQRLRQLTNESAIETLKSSQQIILEAVQKILFAGDGICGSNQTFGSTDTATLKPQEFDFMNVLTVDPTSNVGQIVYEKDSPDKGLIKMNKKLHSLFGAPNTPELYKATNGNSLFSLSWDESNQRYNVAGLQGKNIKTFFTDYYSSIEPVDFSGVTKTAIYMTLHGDGSEPPLFDKGFNDLNRLLAKLCAMCGNPKSGKIPNTTTEFNENDEDIQSYFDFDDVEGVDLDDEKDRLDKVLKFRDCNNFKIPINPTHFEDFVYDDGNLNDSVNDALFNAASDAHNQSEGSIPPDNFHLSILNTFILSLPKALIGSLLSPKYFLPFIIVYKILVTGVGGVIKTAKQMMKILYKLFNEIITKLLWKFINEFWRRVKKDLIVFLTDIAATILKKKGKRYRLILLSLIAILTKILESGFDTCKDLYGLINKAIDLALSGFGGGFATAGISTFLLPFFLQKPGYSEDSAVIRAIEKLEEAGVPTSPIFGEDNKIIDLVKSVISGHVEEQDTNGFIAASNTSVIIPHPSPFVGAVFIPPGLLTVGGGTF
jgi:hypothetical protein